MSSLGFKKEIEKGERPAGNYITFTFGWLIIVGLALVEFFLYLLVGTQMSYDFDEVTEAIIDGLYLELFLAGGWLSLLGPTIVLGLYIFGHRVVRLTLTSSKNQILNVSKLILMKGMSFF